MSNAAILLGAGESSRMEGLVEDKIVTMILEKPVFAYSIEAFIKSSVIDSLVIVYKNVTQKAIIEKWIAIHMPNVLKVLLWAKGGAKRQDSVLSGLKMLSKSTKNVFIHDLARPLIQSDTIESLYEFLLTNKAAALAHRIVDTIKQVSPQIPQKLNTLDRTHLWGMETPQAFPYWMALEAYQEVAKQNLEVTDDAAAVSLLGHSIEILENKLPNPKITIKTDIDYITFLLSQDKVLNPCCC